MSLANTNYGEIAMRSCLARQPESGVDNMIRKTIALLFALVLSVPTLAQQGAVDGGFGDDLSFSSYLELYVNSECQAVEPGRSDPTSLHTQLCEKTGELLLKSVDDEINNIDEKNNVIFLTNISANITFVLAHIFLLIGCFLAYKEIRHANALRKEGKAQEVELKVGLEGVALKSSFLGFAVLTLALAFYFAYLKFVYPVIVI